MPDAARDRPLADRRALVTGASSGIGLAIAHRLAARGATLVLTARREDKLRDAAAALTAAHGGEVDVIPADLGRPDGAAALWTAARAGGAVDVLVNNAGFGYFRPFTTAEWARDAELIQLNITSVVELAHRFVADHRATPPAHRVFLMNVASTAAFQAVPNFAVYASSKAFVRNFSEALHYELAASPIGVTCVCPGGTVTEFHAAAGAGDYGKLATASMLSADKVAELGVRALLRGKKTVVTGFMNKLSCWLAPRAPSGLASRSASWVLGRPKTSPLPARLPGGGT
jgi:short-subunit dehydrogenase